MLRKICFFWSRKIFFL